MSLRYVPRERTGQSEHDSEISAGRRRHPFRVTDDEPRLIADRTTSAEEDLGFPSRHTQRRENRRKGASGPLAWLAQRLRSSLAGSTRPADRLRPDRDRFATLRRHIGREIVGDAPPAALASSPETVPPRPVIAADVIAPSRFAPDIDAAPRGTAEPFRVDGDDASRRSTDRPGRS
jgi:hypothetical protein